VTTIMAGNDVDVHSRSFQRRWWILGVLCLSVIIVGMDNFILNVALPTLVRDLHASETQLQWMVDAYILLFAALLLTMGSLGDRFGRRSLLQIGLVVFGVGSLLSAFSQSPNMLIFMRALMGVGAAAMLPSTLSILTNAFPHEERARAIGVWAGVSAIGLALGPILGGWLLEHFPWGSVFLINVPIVVVALIAGQVILPNSRDPSAPRLDPIGAGLSIVGLVALVFGIIEVPTRGWTSGEIISSFAAAAVVLATFVAWEVRCDHPVLNLTFFRNPSFSAANLTTTLTFFGLSSSLFFVTQYFQFILGYSPLQTGFRLLPMVLTMLIMAPISPRVAERFGNKLPVSAGMLIAAGGMFFFSKITPESGYSHALIAMITLAVGLFLAMVPATNSIMGSLPLAKAGVGSAMNDTTRQVGGAFGVAVLGSILTSTYRSSIQSSLGALPPQALAAAKDSVGAAIAVGNAMGGQTGDFVIAAAKNAFVDGMTRGLEVGTFFILASAVVAFLWLPNRIVRPDETKATPAGLEDEDAI
jgi:EmrB/QacA subfamily drug resistance transporter